MKAEEIIEKFGDLYATDERTFKMGIDQRITARIAERFRGRHVLETCTGGGFSTIALAREARRVITIEIDKKNQDQARENVARAGLTAKVDFILGDSLDRKLLGSTADIHAAFLDPDWADTGAGHVYHFRNSNTRPPADLLLKAILQVTKNVALILPPLLAPDEFRGLPDFEMQKIFMNDKHALYCLYFGDLVDVSGESELRIVAG
jgi:tRNA1(Val) A37 N6-methylase TrmN6